MPAVGLGPHHRAGRLVGLHLVEHPVEVGVVERGLGLVPGLADQVGHLGGMGATRDHEVDRRALVDVGVGRGVLADDVVGLDAGVVGGS